MKLARTFLTFVILLTPLISYPQFGKMLKEKAKGLANSKNLGKIKKFTSEKLEDERTKFDSTSFNYSISQSDNASLFAVREKGEGILKVVTNINKSDEEMTEAQKARRYLDAGEGLYASEKYSKAEALFKLAKLEYELNELTDDVNYLKVLSNLGLLYSTMGRYTAAEEYITDALEKRREKLGENSSGFGSSLNNLAVLHKETGRFNEAEIEIKKAVEINKSVHGEESMPYAISLNNEAMLYQDMGRYKESEELMNKTLNISSQLQSDKSENHQKFLSNLALLYQESGQYELAEGKFKELISLKERRFGTKHPDYAHLLNNLASLYVEMERYGEVEDLLKKSNEIYKNKFGEDHRSYAKGLSDLGNFYRFQGKYDESESLLKNALKIREEALGDSHPTYVQSLEDLAILYWNLGKTEDASKLYSQSLNKSIEFINSYFPPMSEAEKTRYWDKLRPRFERFYSFAIDKKRDMPELLIEAYNYHIATKGLLLSSTTKIKIKILQSGDEELIKEYVQWLDQKETLARYYNYSKEELDEQNVNLDSLQSVANRSEKSLSQKSAVFSDGYKSDNVDIDEIRSKLKATEAIVELIRVRNYSNKFTGDITYLALILKAGQSGVPEYAVIENGVQLEERYYKYYNNTIHQKLQDEYSYKQYWLPIDALIADRKRIYLSPDGIYSQININTLKNSSGKYLLDTYQITLISNSKNIHINRGKKTTRSAILIGNPEFGSAAVDALPGTKVEIDNIARMLTTSGYKTQKFTGLSATETKFKDAGSPSILHIATHGYFLKDKEIRGDKVFGVSAESARDNPLLRSGLLLKDAGKTISDEYRASMENSDNGILTAYEALNLDLDQTSLVVLSACETGTGDVKAGEGVYGLQRAFLAAGADALIMSLWKVSDQATQQLMTLFYKYWIRYNDRQRAFNQAQIEVKTKYKDPYFWGAFVMVEN